MADDIDQLRRDAFFQGFGFVRRPFELAVELARGDEDRQLAQTAAKPGIEPQIMVERARHAGKVRAVQLDAARPAQPAQVLR